VLPVSWRTIAISLNWGLAHVLLEPSQLMVPNFPVFEGSAAMVPGKDFLL